MTKKLAIFALVLALPACATVSKWSKSSMDWADRSMPTYDDWFGDGSANEYSRNSVEQEVGQIQPMPPAQIAAQPLQQVQPVQQVPAGQHVIYQEQQQMQQMPDPYAQYQPQMSQQPEFYVDAQQPYATPQPQQLYYQNQQPR